MLKNNIDPNKKKETLLQSDEQMVCAPEFPDGCMDVEMDITKEEK